MKVYIDILLIINWTISYLFLKLLSKLSHCKFLKKRLIIASVIGSASSLLMFIEPENFMISLLITLLKFFSVILIMIISIGKLNINKILNYTFIYIIINLVLGGCCMLLFEFADCKIIFIHNLTIYFDIPVWLIIFCVIICYILLSIYDNIVSFKLSKQQRYKAKYCIGDYELTIPAICDSGNMLSDCFTGDPVVIFSCNELYYHFNLDDKNKLYINGFRLVPFSTINGNNLIPVTSKGRVFISDCCNNEKEIKCSVGIKNTDDNKSRAIFNPRLLI